MNDGLREVHKSLSEALFLNFLTDGECPFQAMGLCSDFTTACLVQINGKAHCATYLLSLQTMTIRHGGDHTTGNHKHLRRQES